MQNWQKELIRCLFHYSTHHLNIERAFQIKDPHVPNSLYKYRQFCENHQEALSNNVLWRCAPDNFNDPYDTSMYFNMNHILIENRSLDDVIQNTNVSSEGIVSVRPRPLRDPIRIGDWQRRVLEEIISAEHDNMPAISELDQIAVSIFEQQNEINLARLVEYLQRGFSVASLSEVPLSILMWSHYSDAHRGFCIEYDFSAISAADLRRRLCFPVYYREKLTNATRYVARSDPTNLNNLFGIYLCLLKSDEWAYEKEWRIVMPTGPAHATAEIRMPAPASIILGMRVDENNERWMAEHCRRNDIPLKKVRQRRDAFRLELVPHGESSSRGQHNNLGEGT